MGGCIYILIVNHAYLGESFRLIFESAFSARAAGSGFVGTTVMMAARYGIARGLFSNESGLGSAPIVAAAAQTRNPVPSGTGLLYRNFLGYGRDMCADRTCTGKQHPGLS